MNTKVIQEKLEQQKESLERELKGFAKEDSQPKGDWDTKFPKSDSNKMEDAADEMQEYEKLLSVEYNLELKLRDVNLALDKIKEGKYGSCEKCGKTIDLNRLEACPEARLCSECK